MRDRRPDRGADTVVIGYGSELRGDDALGPTAARIVDSWKVDGLSAIACHQLTPELAASLSRAKRVLFIDASAPRPETPILGPVEARETENRLGHTGGPGELLALVRALYGRSPQGWLLELPAHSFELGALMTEAARWGLSDGLNMVCDWIAGISSPVVEERELCMR
jgi:hydrogenase maturation protease